MTDRQQRTALVAAIIAGVVSLPMTWFTVSGSTARGGFPAGLLAGLAQSRFDVSAFNGSVTLLFKTPLWFVVLVALAASGMQLLRNSRSLAIPRAAEWGAAILGTVWTGLIVVVVLASEEASLGMGALLGLCSAAVPLMCLVVGTKRDDVSSPAPHGEL